LLASLVIGLVLARFLPKTTLFHQLVSQSASGARADAEAESTKATHLGRIGVTISPLCPGGKARFGEELLDVVSRGDMIPKGASVRIVGHSGPNPIVETAE
jgi:membrane-bound ClpP family serine protease